MRAFDILAILVLVACDARPHDIPDAPVDVDVAMPAPCELGRTCARGETCTTTTTRCECAAHGSNLVCESLACPATAVTNGTSCTQPGLVCDPDFEFYGFRCTGPENVFVECMPGGTPDTQCPFLAPTPGAPCCWLEIGWTPVLCAYPSDPGAR